MRKPRGYLGMCDADARAMSTVGEVTAGGIQDPWTTLRLRLTLRNQTMEK